MSGRTLAQQVPNREAVDDRVEGARFQIEALKGELSSASSLAAAESCVSAAVDQILQAVAAALDGLNSMLPDPVPTQRISRKNLRDQFYAVNAESAALQSLDNAAHPGDGWLWSLEQKHDGAAFGHLLVRKGETISLVRDPFDSDGGTENEDPVSYLNHALDQVLEVLSEIGERASDDVATYREAQRMQARRLI